MPLIDLPLKLSLTSSGQGVFEDWGGRDPRRTYVAKVHTNASEEKLNILRMLLTKAVALRRIVPECSPNGSTSEPQLVQDLWF